MNAAHFESSENSRLKDGTGGGGPPAGAGGAGGSPISNVRGFSVLDVRRITIWMSPSPGPNR